MKKIETVIRTHTLDAVKDALTVVGVVGMTVSEVRGRSHEIVPGQVYRAVEFKVEYIPKTMIEIVVPDEMVDPVVDAIERSARTGVFGKVGDGMIFVLPIHDAIRVRTGEHGELAL